MMAHMPSRGAGEPVHSRIHSRFCLLATMLQGRPWKLNLRIGQYFNTMAFLKTYTVNLGMPKKREGFFIRISLPSILAPVSDEAGQDGEPVYKEMKRKAGKMNFMNWSNPANMEGLEWNGDSQVESNPDKAAHSLLEEIALDQNHPVQDRIEAGAEFAA